MATLLMEGSYYILLSVILLIYIAAKTTDRCTNYTAFLRHRNSLKTMAHSLPNQSFNQTPQYSANHHNTQTYPQIPRQGGRFPLDTLNRNNVQTTVSLDQYNVDRTGTLGLHKKIITYYLKTETLRHSNFSSLGVTHHPPIPTSIAGYPVPGLAVRSGGGPQGSISKYDSTSSVATSSNVSLQKTTLRQQLASAINRNLPDPPEFAHGRNVPIHAAPLNGVNAEGSSNLKDLATESPNMIPESDVYTPRPVQPFFSQSNANSLEPPQCYDPSNHSTPHYHLSSTNTNHLGPPGISATHPTSNMDLLVPDGTSFNGLGCSDRFTHSQTSTPYRGAPNKSSPHHTRPSNIPTSSHNSTIYSSKPNTKSQNTPGSLRNLAIRHPAPKVGKAKPIQRSKKTTRRRVGSQVKSPTNFDPSGTSDHRRLVRDTTNVDTFDYPGTSIQDPFELFTTHYFPNNDTAECKVRDRPITPDVDMGRVPDAELPTNLEPSNTTDHSHFLVRDTSNLNTFDSLGTSSQDPFELIKDQYHPEKDTNECKEVDEPSAPSIDKNGVPDVELPINLDPSGPSDHYHLVRNMTNLDSFDFSGTSIPIQGHSELFTNQYHLDNDMDERKVADELSAPSVDNSRSPDAMNPHVRQCFTGHPVGDVGAVERPRPPKKRVQQKKDQQLRKAKIERQHRSIKEKRKNPMKLSFCTKPECKCSRETRAIALQNNDKTFNGFKTAIDMRRHADTHTDPKYRCPLPHTKTPVSAALSRRDNLKTLVLPPA